MAAREDDRTDLGRSPSWAYATTSEEEFKAEQDRLNRVWTLLGLTTDLKNDGDWFRATLGGRSVFVQRFGDVLKGFENRCAHRFYPLRTSDKGNGPIVCGFHHWRYNQDGEALGIPICSEVFGVTPRELGARLNPVEIATCGSLVFGRFPENEPAQGLEDFLGQGFPIVEVLGSVLGKPHYLHHVVDANWKMMLQITLDDYHIVAVHGSDRYHENSEISYFRFGPHSAHFIGGAETLESMAAQCREDKYRPSEYRIFNIFPNLAISLFRAAPYWYALAQQFVPVKPGRTILRGWFYRTRLLMDEESTFDRMIRPFSEPIRARIVRHYIDKTGHQDNRACERLQQIVHQVNQRPILGSQEQRIAWFQEAYAQALGAGLQ